MAVTFRLYVAEVTRYAGPSEHAKIVLRAALKGEANASWSKFTPSAEFVLQVTNPAAIGQFEDWMAQGVDIAGSLDRVVAE